MLQRCSFKSSGSPLKRPSMKQSAKLMQRTPMKPGTKGLKTSAPMKSASTFQRKTPMSKGAKALTTSSPMKSAGAPMKRSSFDRSPTEKSSKSLAGTDSKPDQAKPQKMPKRMKSKRKSVPKDERDHMGRVAELGCILCQHIGYGATPAIVHHLRTGQGKMRATNWLTLPLCPDHHQHSGIGVHDMGRKQFYERYGVSEIGLLVQVFQRLDVNQSDPRFAVPPDAITAAENDEVDLPEDEERVVIV